MTSGQVGGRDGVSGCPPGFALSAMRWRPGLGPGGATHQPMTVGESLNSTVPYFPSAKWV